MNPHDSQMKPERDRLFRQFSLIGRALSSPKRLEVLELLSQGERSVEQLARETQMSASNLSQHLHTLRTARLVDSRKEGLYVFYRLADAAVGKFWQSLQLLSLERSAEAREIIGAFTQRRDQFEAITYDELVDRAGRGDLVVLDVRPRPEFDAGHIPDAQSIPLNELPNRMDELPSDREIVAYCRSAYCLLSVDAVEHMREHGLTARRLEGGLPQWRARGYPVVTDDDDSLRNDS